MTIRFLAPAVAAGLLAITGCAQLHEGMVPPGEPALGSASNNGPALGGGYAPGTPQCDSLGTGTCYVVYEDPQAAVGQLSNLGPALGGEY